MFQGHQGESHLPQYDAMVSGRGHGMLVAAWGWFITMVFVKSPIPGVGGGSLPFMAFLCGCFFSLFEDQRLDICKEAWVIRRAKPMGFWHIPSSKLTWLAGKSPFLIA